MSNFGKMISLCMILILTSFVFAGETGKISGSVTDQQSGDPLIGVNVLIVGTTMGAATDDKGDYMILQVPPGIYAVSAQYIGYAKLTTENVRVVTDLTTKMDFILRREAVEGEEVTIIADRPLFERDATNEVRVVRGEQIQNMTVRGFDDVASLQTGVVSDQGALHFRGGRSDETAFYVDGVFLNASPYTLDLDLTNAPTPNHLMNRRGTIPNLALEEVAMQIGGFGAEYGDANAGVVNVTTKTGGDRLSFSGEAITDAFLSSDPSVKKPVAYSYGYNLFSGALGGPVPFANYIRFYASFENLQMDDSYPANTAYPSYDKSTLDPTNGLPDNGESFTDLNGNTFWDSGETFVDEDGDGEYDAPTYLDSDLAENVSFKYGPKPGSAMARSSFAGNVLVDLQPVTGLAWKLKLGGNFYDRERSNYVHSWSLLNYYNDANTANGVGSTGNLVIRSTASRNTTSSIYAKLQGNIPGMEKMFFNVQINKASDFGRTHDPVFKQGDGKIVFDDGTVSDFVIPYIQAGKREDFDNPSWRYEDSDGNEVNKNYWDFDTSLAFQGIDYDTSWINPFYSEVGSRPAPRVEWAYFRGAGYTYIDNRKDLSEHTSYKTSLTWQVGKHELKSGFEYRDNTIRFYRMARASSLARFFQRNNAYSPDQDIWTYNDSLGAMMFGGSDNIPDYMQDQTDTWDDTMDVNDDGAINWDDYYDDFVFQGYKSAYAENLGYNITGLKKVNSGLDRARKPVIASYYLQDKFELDDLVMTLGLRYDYVDPENKIFNPATGGRENIVITDAGTIADMVYWDDRNGDGVTDTLEYTSYRPTGDDVVGLPHRILSKTRTFWSPRVGFAFPVTDKTVFHAQYGKYVQQPELNRLFLSYTRFLSNLEQGNYTTSQNPDLKPVNTTAYEIGFKQLISPDISVDATVFYKQMNNYIQIRNVPARPTGYALYVNGDYGTVKGLSLSLNTRRLQNWQITANYTLQYAGGTGSNSSRQYTIAWLGGNFPTFISPLDFDQRHTGNVVLDFRTGDRGNVFFRNLGYNLLLQFGSGLRYTPSKPRSDVFGGSLSDQPIAALNSGVMPWTFNIDVRLDKSFSVGPSQLTVFLWVENLLDRQNVSEVYSASGLPNNDGYLATPAGQTWLSTAAVNSAAFGNSLYQNRIGTPYNYGKPRQIRFGVRFNL